MYITQDLRGVLALLSKRVLNLRISLTLCDSWRVSIDSSLRDLSSWFLLLLFKAPLISLNSASILDLNLTLSSYSYSFWAYFLLISLFSSAILSHLFFIKFSYPPSWSFLSYNSWSSCILLLRVSQYPLSWFSIAFFAYSADWQFFWYLSIYRSFWWTIFWTASSCSLTVLSWALIVNFSYSCLVMISCI
jgi:hypothetical protein